MSTYLDEAALIAGIIVALVGLYWQGVKARADVQRAVAEIAKINHEMAPNSGKSLHDLVTATSNRVKELATSVGGIRDDMRIERLHTNQLSIEKTEAHHDIRARLDQLEQQAREKDKTND